MDNNFVRLSKISILFFIMFSFLCDPSDALGLMKDHGVTIELTESFKLYCYLLGGISFCSAVFAFIIKQNLKVAATSALIGMFSFKVPEFLSGFLS